MDAAAPFGHGPMRKALIEVTRQESNERRMDPGVDVEVVYREKSVAVANLAAGRRRGRRVSPCHGFEARQPQPVYPAPFVAEATVQPD